MLSCFVVFQLFFEGKLSDEILICMMELFDYIDMVENLLSVVGEDIVFVNYVGYFFEMIFVFLNEVGKEVEVLLLSLQCGVVKLSYWLSDFGLGLFVVDWD